MGEQRERPPFRHVLYAALVCVAALWVLNFAVEFLEDRGVVDTSRPDDVVHFLDEELFKELVGTPELVQWYSSRGTPETHQIDPARNYMSGVPAPEDDRRYFVTTDPYAECEREPFENPFKPGDPKYKKYRGRTVYHAYRRKSNWHHQNRYISPR